MVHLQGRFCLEHSVAYRHFSWPLSSNPHVPVLETLITLQSHFRILISECPFQGLQIPCALWHQILSLLSASNQLFQGQNFPIHFEAIFAVSGSIACTPRIPTSRIPGNSRKCSDFGPRAWHACSVSMLILYFPEVKGNVHCFTVQEYFRK